MINYKATDVYTFLNNQFDYLTGDLAVFNKICREVESTETFNCTTSSPITSSLGQPQSISSSVTNETTRNLTDFIKSYRLTIPVTLSLFSAIDSVGFLSGSNDNAMKTDLNFKEFFAQSPIEVKPKDVELITCIFRQGLSHVYFPKLNLGLSYHSKNPADKLIFRNRDNSLTLNINVLEKIVINTFEIIKEKSEIYDMMENKYQALIKTYEERDGDKILNYDSE